jgi:hypothetical protein
MNKLIALLLIFSNSAYAGNAIKVHTGDVVKPEFNDGTLLDKEQAERIKDQLIERDAFEKQNDSYEKSIELYKKNEKLYQDQNSLLLNRNIELTKAVNDSRETSDLLKIGYFVLGVAVTGAAVWGASRLTK